MISIPLRVSVEETPYESPSEWRILGGRGKAEHVIALCSKHGVVPTSLLEVGAGEGAILRHLGAKAFCHEMHAVEISESGVGVILDQKIPGLISCQRFNGYNLPFKDDSFDLVILSHVLEHVEFERALLREVRRVSKYQVIEIPMDFPALRNDNFHLLGPSYGHINAYTPEALRFLLATEGLRVLDSMLGEYSLAVQEYDHFINNGREKTPESVKKFREDFERRNKTYESLSLAEKQEKASYYAVLTKREDPAETLSRAMTAAKSYIQGGQPQPARLIFRHYVPKNKVADAAAELAQFCYEAGELETSQQFVSIALDSDPAHRTALRIQADLGAASDRSLPRSDSMAPYDARQSVSPLGQWLKRGVPTMVAAARVLRDKIR